MLRTRIRKIRGDFFARKGRTALVIISIMIGVFGVTTLVGMNDQVVSQLRNDLQPDNIAMSHLYLSTTSDTAFSAEDNQAIIDELSQLTGVTDVEGQAFYPADFRTTTDGEFEEGHMMAFSTGLEDADLEPISRVVEGRYPVVGQNELMVEQRFAEEYGVDIGDMLYFRQPGQLSESGEGWEIVGIAFYPYFAIDVAIQGEIEQTDMIFTQYEDAQAILDFKGLTSLYLRYDNVTTAEEQLDALQLAVATNTSYIPIFSFLDDPDESFIIGQVKNVTGVLDMLAGLSVIVSGFLVTNVINTIVMEQKQQIGVMKSLGATRFDNIFIYVGMALTYGVIGATLGVLLALPVASLLATSLAPLANTYIDGFGVSTTSVVLGFVLGLIVPVVAALIPVYNGTRVSILAAMTDLGISSNWGKSRLARWIGNFPLPINIRQALSNITQKGGRLALTGITLTLAVGAFMGVTAVFTALGDTVDDIFSTFDYEMEIVPQEAQDYDTINTLLTENHDNVTHVYAGYNVAVEVEGFESPDPLSEGSNQLQAIGIDPATPAIQFDLEEGSGWQNDPTRNGVVITRTLADNIEKSVGGTVTLTVAGQAHDYEIIGVDTFPFEGLFMNWQELATISQHVDADGNPLAGNFFIGLSGAREPENVDDAITDITATLLNNNIQASYTNQVQVEEDQIESLTLFSMIFNMTSGVMAAVGAVGLLATLFMSVYERQKEIGVMRSIGARSSTIVTQFLVEGLLVGVIAWILAIPLSVLLGLGLADAMDFGTGFTFTYPPQVLVMGLVGVVMIAAVASIWPSISASRRTVSEILRYQ